MFRFLLFFALSALSAAPQAQVPQPPPVIGKAWIVADLDSGQVLAGRDEYGQFAPASTIKVLLAVTVLDELPLDATVVALRGTVDGLLQQRPGLLIQSVGAVEIGEVKQGGHEGWRQLQRAAVGLLGGNGITAGREIQAEVHLPFGQVGVVLQACEVLPPQRRQCLRLILR